MKKVFSLIFATVLTLSCMLPAFATDKVTVSATEEDNAFAVTGIHLPTKAELDTLSGSIRNYSLTYWKAMEGESHDYAPYVDNSGSIRTSLADKLRAVRPVIELKNVAKSNHKVGEKFTFGGKNFVIISETAAFCLTDIAAEQVYDGSMYIPDKFEDTAISRFINEFYAKNIGEGYKFITVEEKDDTYTLSFDTAGIKTIEAVKLAKDAAIALPDAKVTGYKFNGWFTDKEYKTKFVATKMPAEDITIYASYTKLYKLSFNTQDLKKIDAMWLEEGAAIVLPSADVENYKFMGWFTDAKYQKAIEKDAKMPKADTVLYGCYAIKLSKLGTILKDIDIEQFVKDSKLSPETFNKLAKSLGFEVKYSVNGKTYTVNDVVNFTDELTAQLKKDIKFGDIAAVDITISLGKDDGENLAIYVYNDIEDKEADKPTTTKDTTSPTEPSSGIAETSTTNVIIIKEKKDENPETGSSVLGVTAFAALAVAGIAFVAAKKKED